MLLLFGRLAQANKDMAELNSRLVDAAFGSAFGASKADSAFTPSVAGIDQLESTKHFDRHNSYPGERGSNKPWGQIETNTSNLFDTNNIFDKDSNPAASSSGEQASLVGLPPGVPLDPFYEE